MTLHSILNSPLFPPSHPPLSFPAEISPFSFLSGCLSVCPVGAMASWLTRYHCITISV